jgi:hypothetical protein
MENQVMVMMPLGETSPLPGYFLAKAKDPW